MHKYLLLLPLAAFGLYGCGGEKGGDSAEDTATTTDDPPTTTTTPYDGPTLIDVAGFSCPDGDTWAINVDTIGWTTNGVANMWETGNLYGWDEEHTVPSVSFDPNMWWDKLERTLADESEVSAFTPDSNTVFTCGVHDADPVMTYMVRVYDQSDALADCWIFSTDPDGITTVQGGGQPTNNTVSDDGDIAGCSVM